MTLSIIIPAYNEADRIVATLEQTLAYFEKQNLKTEIVVVSDGSSDNTEAVVKRFQPAPISPCGLWLTNPTAARAMRFASACSKPGVSR